MENKDFIISGYNQVDLQFSMTGFAVVQVGKRHVTLKKSNDVYSVEFPKANLRNIVFGNKHVYFSGKLKVVNEKTGEKIKIEYPKKGWTSKGDFLAHGSVFDKDGKKVYEFDGHWMKYGKLIDPITKKEIKEWKT